MKQIAILILLFFLSLSSACGRSEGIKLGAKEIKVEAYQFNFSPDPIVVKRGDSVKLHISSRDVTHGFYIKEYGINAAIKKGEITEIYFLADKAGRFDIICSVFCGPGHSKMKGRLIVEE